MKGNHAKTRLEQVKRHCSQKHTKPQISFANSSEMTLIPRCPYRLTTAAPIDLSRLMD